MPASQFRDVRIALIGQGFMGRAHSHAYRNLAAFYPPERLGARAVMQVLVGRDAARLPANAERLGWAGHESDWRRAVEREDVDLVDCSTSNDLHWPIIEAAARAGKAILCEKPLARSLAEARTMLDAVQRAGVVHMVGFNMRAWPAVRLARRLVEQGVVGQPLHWHAEFYNERLADPTAPATWRMAAETAGAGALADLGSHIIDLAHWLVGPIVEVAGTTTIRTAERGAAGDPSRRVTVTVDDAAVFTARFESGALGTFVPSKLGTGHKNDLSFELIGDLGAIRWGLQSSAFLDVYRRDLANPSHGWTRVNATEPHHPPAAHFWPSGHPTGFGETFINQAAELLGAIAEGRAANPDFVDGVRAQAVIEAVLTASASRRWESVPGS
jgi:predicted dehydrogenase